MSDAADNSSTTTALVVERSCDDWRNLLQKINHFFRDEGIVAGTEHSSVAMGYVVVTAYALVITIGAAGNVLTMLAVIRNPAMRTTRNFFIVNLALSDFFVCTVTAPITLYTVLYMFWPFGTAFCKIAGSLQAFNIFLSTFSITAIALDRYVLVIFPTTQRFRQHNLSLLFFLCIWLSSLLLALPLLIASDVNVIFEDAKCGIQMKLCHEQNDLWKQMPISRETYTLSALAVQYAFPLISIAFVYSRIAHRMRMRFNRSTPLVPSACIDSNRRRSAVERQRRTHLLLGCVVVVFAVAWLPLNLFHIANTFQWVSRFSVPTFAACHVCAICSACLNPVSYAFFNYNFRQQFLDMFTKAGVGQLRRLVIGVQEKYTDRHKPQNNNTQMVIGNDECTRILPPIVTDVVVMVNTV